MIAPTLGRYETRTEDGPERLHWLWVAGPHGAVSTWFGDTVEILGHSVCDGPTLHSVVPLDYYSHAHDCDFTTGDVWCARETMLETPAMAKHYDSGEIYVVYRWLASWYLTMRNFQEDAR